MTRPFNAPHEIEYLPGNAPWRLDAMAGPEQQLDRVTCPHPQGAWLRIVASGTYWRQTWSLSEPNELHLTYGKITNPPRPSKENENIHQSTDSDTRLGITPLRETRNCPRVEALKNSGETRLIIVDSFGLFTNNHYGLPLSRTDFTGWSIHPDKPMAAHRDCPRTQEMSRKDIKLGTQASCKFRSRQENKALKVIPLAIEGEATVFTEKAEGAAPQYQM